MSSVTQDIVNRVADRGPGAVFGPRDFLDLGSRAAVDKGLSRLAKRGVVRRVAQGIYDYPKVSRRVGARSPSLDKVARVVADRTRSRLQISGAHAANRLGLSKQVPAQRVYLTDGPTRDIEVGGRVIRFKHASPRNLVGAGRISGDVFQALRYLGTDSVDDGVISTLRRRLSDQDKQVLARDALDMPGWVRQVIQQVVGHR